MTVESFLDSGFFGAILGGVGTLLASRLEINSEAKKEKIRELEEFIRISIAIKQEFICTWEMFNVNIGRGIVDSRNNSEKFLKFTYKIDSEYFPIYKNNTNIIGSFQDENLIKNIISLYINASALIDSLKLYTEDYQYYLKIYRNSPDTNSQEIKNKESELIEQSDFIFSIYSYIGSLISDVDKGIENQISKEKKKLDYILKGNFFSFLFRRINNFFSKPAL